MLLLFGGILFQYTSAQQITANVSSELGADDFLSARLLAYDKEVGGAPIGSVDIRDVSTDEFGSFSLTIPDDLLILPNVSYVQLCLDGDVSARPLSLADDANDPTTLPTTSSSSQSSLDGTADCNDATNAAHTYELTSCQRQPIPTNPSWLSRTFGTAQQTFHVDNFCGQVFASADVEQLAQTNQLPQLQLNGDTLTLGESSVDLSKYLQEDTQPTVITNTITGTGTDDQTIDASLSNQDLTVSIEDGGSVTVDLSPLLDNSDDQVIAASFTGTNLTISLEDGGTKVIDLSSLDDSGTDDQLLSLIGTDLTIEDGNTVDLSAIDTNTDSQTLGLAGTTLSITGGNSIDLSPIDTDTDDQTLTFTPGTGDLTIADGNTVNLNALYDNTDTLAALGCGSGQVAQWNGSAWICATVGAGGSDTDNQVISLAGNILTLSGGLVPDTTVDLSAYLDDTDTDDQTLSFNMVTGDLTIADGNTVDMSAFFDDTTVDNQALSISGNNLELTSDDGTDTVDLSGYLDDTDDQTLSLAGTMLTIADGNTIDLASIDTTVDNQVLSISGNTLELTSDDGTDTVDLSGYLDNTDNQDLSLAGNTLSLTNDGTTVDLSGYLDDTTIPDDQTLSLAGTTLTIVDGNSVDLSPIDTDTDDQTLTFTPGTGDLTIADGNTVNLNALYDNTDAQDLSLAGNTLSLTNDGTTVDLSAYLDDTTIADDQTLSFAPGTGILTIADGNNVDMSAFFDDTTTDNQQISLAGNIITLDNGTGADTTVNLSAYLDNTDSQDLSLAGNTLSLTNDGTTVDLSGYLDDTTIPDDQTLSLAGTTLTIVDGNSVDLSPIDTDTDDQTLTFTPGTGDLTIADGNTVNLNALYDNTDTLAALGCGSGQVAQWNGASWICASAAVDTDDQTLSIDGSDNLTIVDGNSVSLTPYLDNTDSQDLSLAGNTLSLTGDGTTVDLSAYLDDTDTDDQTLSFNMVTGDLTIADGNTVDMSAFFDDTTVDNQALSISGNNLELTSDDGTDTVDLSGYLDDTDDQTLSLAGTMLTIADGNTIDLASIDTTVDNQVLSISGNTLELTSDDGTDTVDLSGYLDNTDNQDLSLAGNTLSLTNDGTTVDLSGYLDDTTIPDDQTLSLAGTTLTIVDGNSVDLSPIDTDTDDQTLTFTPGTGDLTIADGNTVNLNALYDNTDAQDLSLAGNTLSLTNDGTTVDLSAYLDDTTIADDQTLSFAPGTGILTIADGNNVDMSAFFDDTTTDNQQISLAGNIITLDNGTGADTTVNLSAYLDNTDSQDLSLAGNTLSLTNDGTTVDLTSYLDNTDAQTLGLAGAVLSISGGNNVNIDPVIGNEVTNATTDGGLERAGAGTGASPYTLGLRTDCGDNEALTWDNGGSAWVCTPTQLPIGQFRDGAGGTSINTAAYVAVPWNTEDVKESGITHSNVTNNSRVTLDSAGTYKISYTINSDKDTLNTRANVGCSIRINGATVLSEGTSYSYNRNSANDLASNTASALYVASANDYYEIVCIRTGDAPTSTTVANESWTLVERIR